MKKLLINLCILSIITPLPGLANSVDIQQTKVLSCNITENNNNKQECYEHNQNTNINKIYEILNNSIPSNTYLTYFMVTNNGEIDIKGNTDKVENVYIFLKNLKDSLIGYQLKITQLDLFTYEASDLYEINRDNTINSYDYYTFEITNVNNKN